MMFLLGGLAVLAFFAAVHEDGNRSVALLAYSVVVLAAAIVLHVRGLA
jgi:hypothetical protein